MSDADQLVNARPNDRNLAPRVHAFLWLLFPTVIVGSCAAGALFWRLPAKVDIEAVVSRAQFHIRGETQQVALDKAEARSLALMGFKEIRLTPETVWIFNPAKYDFERDVYPESGWSRLALPSWTDLVLTPADQTSSSAVTIQLEKKNTGSLKLGNISIGRGTMVLSTPEPRLLSLELRGVQEIGIVELPQTFTLLMNSCAREGSAWPYPGVSIALRIHLAANRPFLKYKPEPSGILFQARFRQSDEVSLLEKSGLTVDQVGFVRPGRLDPNPQTTLDGAGIINFVDQVGATPVKLKADDLLKLDHLREFRVLAAALNKDDKLHLRFVGTAGSLGSGPPTQIVDRRLTLFDMAWHNPKLTALFTVLVWVIPTLIGGRKFLKEQLGSQDTA